MIAAVGPIVAALSRAVPWREWESELNPKLARGYAQSCAYSPFEAPSKSLCCPSVTPGPLKSCPFGAGPQGRTGGENTPDTVR